MRRALAGLGAVAVLVSGCAELSAAEEDLCDRLETYREMAREPEPDEAALQRLVDEFGDVPDDETIAPKIRDEVRTTVRDAERLLRGGEANFFEIHLGAALSVCMDSGW